MNSNIIINYLIEFSFVISVFFITLTWAVVIGRQSVINSILGTYLAIALFQLFPYLDYFTTKVASDFSSNFIIIVIFIILATVSFFLAKKISPAEYRENKFESFPKKVLLAFALTILVLVVSIAILPVNSVLSTPLEVTGLFTNPQLTFWGLVLPLLILIFN